MTTWADQPLDTEFVHFMLVSKSMIRVSDDISLDESEIEESFVRASGPGGQNVNKVSSAVQLRFDVRGSPSLGPEIARRLEKLAGRRLTREGVLVILAQRYRTRERNRADALERLMDLIRRAAVSPPSRRPTRPTAASRDRRLARKQARSNVKFLRRPISGQDDG